MEKVFFNPERNVTISAVIPLSLKNKLLMEASKLGISISEFVYHLIENSGCNAFTSNEIAKKDLEIQALQKQIHELEAKLNQNSLNDEFFERLSKVQETNIQKLEDIEDFADRLNTAYCELKQFAYNSFAEKEIFNQADRMLPDYIRENVIPNLQEMKAKGLENVTDWFVSKLKNPEKIDKTKLLQEVTGIFDKACQMDKALSLKLTEQDKKDIFENIKEDIRKDFENKISYIETNVLLTEDYDLFTTCELSPNPDMNDLESNFEEELERDLRFQTKEKALPTPKTPIEPKVLDDYQPKDKNEKILHELYKKGVEYVAKWELKELGFDTGFFSNLTIRGGKFGKYELKKAPSEKVFRLYKVDDEKTNQ
ncbi:MAG: hypothetical protein RMJ97_11355 [Raineya sp.]|nr:hypothetical protein [Raineya sp.]MDW8297467.1 hypothetical protein [Raineya sp.]